MKSAFYTLLILIVLLVLLRWLINYYSPRPDSLYSGEDTLNPCPSTPNCVSSLAASEQHQIAGFTGEDILGVFQQLVEIIRNQKNARIITQNDRYLHAEFTTRIMGYTDDVELLLDPDNKQVHIRSASRLGKSDLGANRKRVEKLRSLLDTVSP